MLRGTDLTRLMVTLGVALDPLRARQPLRRLTGGADGLQGVVMGPLLGRFAFGLDGQVAYAYSLAVLFVLFLVARRIVHSPFGYSLQGDPRQPRCARRRSASRSTARLVAVYTLAAALRRRRRRAARADHRLRVARRASTSIAPPT